MKLTDTKLYGFALHKAYFDAGYGTSSYVKTLLVVLGISAAIARVKPLYLFLIGLAYGIGCYILGRIMYNKGWILVEKEVTNQYDEFVKEMRARNGDKVQAAGASYKTETFK